MGVSFALREIKRAIISMCIEFVSRSIFLVKFINIIFSKQPIKSAKLILIYLVNFFYQKLLQFIQIGVIL